MDENLRVANIVCKYLAKNAIDDQRSFQIMNVISGLIYFTLGLLNLTKFHTPFLICMFTMLFMTFFIRISIPIIRMKNNVRNEYFFNSSEYKIHRIILRISGIMFILMYIISGVTQVFSKVPNCELIIVVPTFKLLYTYIYKLNIKTLLPHSRQIMISFLICLTTLINLNVLTVDPDTVNIDLNRIKYDTFINNNHPTRINIPTYHEECSICLEKFNQNDEIAALNCNHIYHFNCISLWINHGQITCPICRAQIHTNDQNNIVTNDYVQINENVNNV